MYGPVLFYTDSFRFLYGPDDCFPMLKQTRRMRMGNPAEEIETVREETQESSIRIL
jgi:hypothetical protein